jgi:hypothetical protein
MLRGGLLQVATDLRTQAISLRYHLSLIYTHKALLLVLETLSLQNRLASLSYQTEA